MTKGSRKEREEKGGRGAGGRGELSTGTHLVRTDQMDHDHDIGNVNEPVWVEEAKPSQQVARC